MNGDQDESNYNDYNSDDSSKSLNNSYQDNERTYINSNNYNRHQEKNENCISLNNNHNNSDRSLSEIIHFKKRKLSQEAGTNNNNNDIQRLTTCNKQITFDSSVASAFQLIDLNKAFEDSNFKIKRIHSNWAQPNPKLDISFQLTLSFMSDKIYQVHIETNDRVAGFYQRAQQFIKSKNSITLVEGHNASLVDVWTGLLEGTKKNIKELISFARQIPGFDKVNTDDLKTILDNRLFDFFMIKHSFLFIDGECYIMLPNNIQYTKSWLTSVIGKLMTDALFEFADEFNQLGLTTKEVALMVPYILTIPGIYLKLYPIFLKNLN